jgi:hypothetical protein
MVPAEPLWGIFTPAVIANLKPVRSPSQRLQTRLRILDAGASFARTGRPGRPTSRPRSRSACLTGRMGSNSVLG